MTVAIRAPAVRETVPLVLSSPDPQAVVVGDGNLHDVYEQDRRPWVRTPGTVGVVSSESLRHAEFVWSLQRCLQPAGSETRWATGVDIAANRNGIVRMMLGEWVWFLDDDHVFGADTLIRLLKHLDERDDVDVVVPLCCRRAAPFEPVVFDVDGKLVSIDPEEPGLFEVDAAGTAGMLVKRSVFRTLADPWFECGQGDFPDSRERIGEDVHFCRKAREAGFRVWCDPDTPIGHIGKAVVWPGGKGRVLLAFRPDGAVVPVERKNLGVKAPELVGR